MVGDVGARIALRLPYAVECKPAGGVGASRGVDPEWVGYQSPTSPVSGAPWGRLEVGYRQRRKDWCVEMHPALIPDPVWVVVSSRSDGAIGGSLPEGDDLAGETLSRRAMIRRIFR